MTAKIVKLRREGPVDLIEELHADRENISAVAVSYIRKDGEIFTYYASSLMELAVLVAHLDITLKAEL